MTTYGSLCTGAEMLGMGIEAVLGPLDHLWHAENDPGAVKVLAHHYPNVPNLGDITAVDWTAVAPVDVLAAGFPCQDASHAGKRAGLRDGTRTGLWSSVAVAVDILRPALLLLENVEGLHSARADSAMEPCPWCMGDDPDEPVLRASGRVLGDLSGLGYDARWVTVPASDVGAPHRRKRVFFVAHPAGGAVPAGGVALLPTPAAADSDRASVTYARGNPTLLGAATSLLPTPNAALGRASSPGLPSIETARRRMQDEGRRHLDDAVALLPTPAARDGDGRGEGGPEYWRRRREDLGRDNGVPLGAAVMLLPTPTVADSRGTRNATAGRSTVKPATNNDGWTLSDIAYAERWGEYAPAIARWEQILGRPAPDPTELGSKGQPRLSPAFVEWLMGLPDGWVCAVPGITRNDQLRILGNGVVWQQAAYAYRHLLSIPTPAALAA